jgi:hypothetical protein
LGHPSYDFADRLAAESLGAWNCGELLFLVADVRTGTISIKVLTKLLDYLPQVLCVFLDDAASFL